MARVQDTPLAVIGMACRLPGASNLAEYWQLLQEGRSAIIEAPPERLDRRLHYAVERGRLSKTYTTLGGILQYPAFDATRCPVPVRSFPSAEVGHLTICQVAAEACRHAGMNPFELPLRRAGVYVGHNLGGPLLGQLSYGTLVEQTAQYLRELDGFRRVAGGAEEAFLEELVRRIRSGLPRRGPHGVPVAATHLAAAIIAEAFGLSGPAMILDAACSSALQGLAMAARALQLGRIEMAVVGGASYFHVDSLMLFSRAQSASARGSCPFDAEADGLVAGEGYVAVVLKTLPQALADGDPICAVIRGIGISSDGRGKSLWAPRKEGQVLAIQRAYEGGLDMGRLQYIEAHATSTPVGDVTELKALAEALDGRLAPGAKIPLGAVKANIGHTLEAAGLAGLVKTVLAIEHQTIPQQIHVQRLNPAFDWNQAPFVVPTTNTPWPAFDDGHPRRAAVNSFGIGGLNVHVVLDEFQPETASKAIPRPQALAQPARQEPIAIVGASCIFPGARTLEAFWDLVTSGRDPKGDVPADRWNAEISYEPGSRRPWRSASRRGGFITDFQYDWRRHRVPPNQIAHADPLQLMILDSTDAALADAGYDQKPFDRLRTGVVVGTAFGSEFCDQLQMGFRLPDFCDQLAELLRGRGVADEEIAALQQAYCDTLLKHMPALLDETGGFTPSALASRITKTYDLMGGAATVDSGQASSMAALCSAVDLLLDGSCDVVLCAAGHRAMSLLTYELLSLEGTLAGDDPRMPFDAEARGHLPGEGVGVLVLKRLADAQRDGDRLRGIIRGVGAAFATSRQAALGEAIERAYAAAGAAPEEVVLWETAGTGLPEMDAEEIAAVAQGLAGDARRQPLLLGSVVGQIGHTQGASGMASLLTAVASLEHLQVPAHMGATQPAPALAAYGGKLQLATTSTPLPRDNAQLLAGVSSLDSWGAAYHVVLQRPAPVKVAQPAEPRAVPAMATPPVSSGSAWRIVRLGAASLTELKSQAAEAAEHAASRLAQAEAVRFSPEHSCRLAVVVQDATDLEKKLRLAAEQIGTPAAVLLARKDIFVGQITTPPGKVAFVFSGQGSQYAGMLQTLVKQFPPAAEALRQIDATLDQLGIPRFAEVAWGDGTALGTDVWKTQLSLLCADTIVFRSLQALGIQADVVAGHSYGEYPALAAAGAWDFENAVQGTRVRCQAIEACRNIRGSMLSVAAPGPVVEEVCRALGASVFLANYNAPDQTVVGGTAEGIAQLAEALQARGIATVLLPVPRPFHTPLMEDVQGPLAHGLESIRLTVPQLPMLSSVTNRLVRSPDEIRANLVAQMVRPVRWVDLIGQLAEQGVRAIVEVGPRQVLTGLNSKILAGRDVAVLACDDKERSGLYRLLNVQAALESWGLMDRPAPPVDVVVSSPEPTKSVMPNSTPFEIGRQHGAALAVSFQRLARRYADAVGYEAEPFGIPAAILTSGDRLLADLPEEEREELCGVAEGAGVSPAMLAAYHASRDTGTATAIRSLWSDLAPPPVRTDRRASTSRPPATLTPITVEEYLKASQNVHGQPPFDRGHQVCSRFVMRMLRTPLPAIEDSLQHLSGPALIVGQNAVSEALRTQIEALGVPAVLLPMSDRVEKTLATLEKLWNVHRPPHLFLVTALDEPATARLDAEAWDTRRQRGVMLPYLVCQKWFALVSEAKMVEQASVVAATALGGDFGLSGRIDSLESGAITGLIKALCIEIGFTTNWAFRTKVVDVPRSEPADDVAAALLRELRAISPFAEIGYAQGERYVIGAIPKPVQPAAGMTPTRGRPWLLTGGARGITAAIARELGSRFGVKLHLVGTSPRPEIDPAWRNLLPEQRKALRARLMKQALAEKRLPAELWKQAEKAIEIDQTLRALEDAGIAAVYHTCDVGDRAAVARLLDEIRRSDGPLEGIVHGAGIEVASRYTKKDPQMVAKTIAAKVDGAAILLDLTKDDPLQFFFGFGSIAGRWGSIGQTDYSLASDMLAKLIDWYRTERPECHATCFHWQPWAEIGMAARDETRGGNMLQRLELLPPGEGVQHFVDELLAGCPEPEIIITDWDYYKRFHPDLSEKEVAETYLATPARSTPAVVEATPVEPPTIPVTMRHVMRMVESPWPETQRRPFALSGPALILGDNVDARALARRLTAAGVEVRVLPLGDSLETTLNASEWNAGGRPAPHLFLLTGRDPEATEFRTPETWRRRRDRGVLLPFLVCQEWLIRVNEAGLRGQATLVAATSLGGDFGFAQPVPAPEGGALTGLLKGLYLETQSQKQGPVRTRIVDLPANEPPERVAEALLRELEVEGDEIEVAWSGDTRSVVRLAVIPVEEFSRRDIPRGGVWVFTGGARGITAAVAKEMGRRFGLKLHLLGKSPRPQINPEWLAYDDAQMRQLKRSLAQQATREGKPPGTYWDRIRNDLEIDRNLREMEEAGIRTTYHACDVTDWNALERTLGEIRQADGPIEGIVHGAGIQRPAKTLVERDTEGLVELVNVKVDAAVALLLLTRDDPVRYVVGFGSISGRFGSANASAYTMTNDMLSKLLGWQRFERPDCHAVSFHWHPWGEVGMMTRPAAQHTITIMKMKLLPPAEGAWHLIEELRAGAPESEVLITDAQFYETFYRHNLRIEVAETQASPGALIDTVRMVEPGQKAEIEIHLDPLRDPFLREHRLRDKATLPMVVALEAFAEAAAALDGDARSVVAIRDVQIADAVRFFADEPSDVRVHAERTERGIECRLVSDFRNRRGQVVQKDRLHFAGVVELGKSPVSLDTAEVPALREWHAIAYPSRDALMYHGGPLRLLKRVAFDAAGVWGQIQMPAHNDLVGQRNAAGWKTPSAALDACYYACGVYVWTCAEQGVTVPDRLAELRVGRSPRPSEATVVHLECRELAPKHGVFDFCLIGDDGAVIFEVQGYRCHILRGGAP